MTEEDDESRYTPKLAPRDRPACAVDAARSSDPAPGTHRNGAEHIVCTVIDQLAETLDEDPMLMRPPLGDVIDPEILVRLQQTAQRSEQTYTFTYRGYVVTATSNAAVSVRRRPSQRTS